MRAWLSNALNESLHLTQNSCFFLGGLSATIVLWFNEGSPACCFGQMSSIVIFLKTEKENSMASAYEQYQNLTEKEKAYIKTHPHHVSAIKDSKGIAVKETKRIFGRNGRNDKSDAFRHCFWSALLSKELGYANALKFTTAHESSPLNPTNEKTMDLHNNKVGLKIGQGKKSIKTLSLQCHVALKSNKLKVITP